MPYLCKTIEDKKKRKLGENSRTDCTSKQVTTALFKSNSFFVFIYFSPFETFGRCIVCGQGGACGRSLALFAGPKQHLWGDLFSRKNKWFDVSETFLRQNLKAEQRATWVCTSKELQFSFKCCANSTIRNGARKEVVQHRATQEIDEACRCGKSLKWRLRITAGPLLNTASWQMFLLGKALVSEVLNALLEKGNTCRQALQLFENLQARLLYLLLQDMY